MKVPSFQSGTKPCLTTPPCPNQIGDSNLSGDSSNLGWNLDGESFWAPCGIRRRHIRTMNQERPWPHPTHTPYKAPPRLWSARKKNNHSKSNWPLWLVSPQNLAYRILLFSTWPPHNNSKTRPADRSNPMAYNQAWKHGSLLIGRWIWELRLQLWKHRPLRGKQHTSSKSLRTSNQFWDSRAFVHQVNHQLLKYPCCLIQRHLREKQASWQHSSMHLAWVSVGSAWVQSAKAILQTYHDDVGCSNLGHLNWQEEQKTVNGFHCLCDPLTGRGSSTWAASFIMEKISISAEEF